MIRSSAIRIATGLLTLVLLTTLLPASSFAQSTGLRINPRSDLVVKPGDTQSASLLISNLNKNVPVTVDLSIIDFKPLDESGTPTPILEENVEPTAWSLIPYIKVPKTVELGVGETKYVPFTVTIPQGLGAGSYYSAIKYDPQPSQGQSTVVISGAPMQLVFVTVPGKATELMNLKNFGTYVNNKKKSDGEFVSIFTNTKPQKMAYLLENLGNVAESPTGSMIIKNIFGSKVLSVDNINPKANLALIGQTRRFEVCFKSERVKIKQDGRTTTIEDCKDPGFAPGLYKAEMALYYGIGGSTTQEIKATASFWYLPWWSIGLLLGILAIVAYVIYRIRQKLVGSIRHKRQR